MTKHNIMNVYIKELKVKLHSLLISTLDGSSHFHGLATFTSGDKFFLTHWMGDRLEPRTGRNLRENLSCRKVKLIVQHCRQTVLCLVIPAGYRSLLFNSRNVIIICALKFVRVRSRVNVE